jgi:hypothetical protein
MKPLEMGVMDRKDRLPTGPLTPHLIFDSKIINNENKLQMNSRIFRFSNRLAGY